MTTRPAFACLAAALLLSACTTARAPVPQPEPQRREPEIVPLTLEQQWEIDGRQKRKGAAT